MSSRIRRRDRAIAGERRRSHAPLLIAAAIVLLILVWIALQTLGGHATKS